jgi:hypothetical protein
MTLTRTVRTSELITPIADIMLEKFGGDGRCSSVPLIGSWIWV